MRLVDFFRRCAVTLSVVGLLSGQMVMAAGPKTVSVRQASADVRDVALQESGLLQGQLVDGQGAPQPNVDVVVIKDGQAIAQTKTDGSGRFAVTELSGGIYQIHTAMSSGSYRFWAPGTAPPSAGEGVLMVKGQNVVRGANAPILGFLANPWVLAGIVAAAIAIPLALDDDDAS